MTEKVRIKDIAEKSGVSVGTVDRVLHNRPNVSKKAREKVEKVLKEINYQPNMYASALAYNKSYRFYCIIPQHDSEAYWEEIEDGTAKACETRRDFHISTEIMYYQRYDIKSFVQTTKECLEKKPNGVIVVPADIKVTKHFCETMHERKIPFILLDSYIPDVNPLTFFGQDSFSSGKFAAKMLMLLAANDKEIMLFKRMKNGKVASRQQENRELGFRHYMNEHFPNVRIAELDVPVEGSPESNEKKLEQFFSAHPGIRNCITLGSKAHIVGEFLLKTNRRSVQIMGYDMVEKNAQCLRKGSISFLIAQHAYMQGYHCVDSLFKAIVLHKKVDPTTYMPLELLSKENVDFYRRTQL